jgi:Tfp pilus assembly protein PilZ
MKSSPPPTLRIPFVRRCVLRLGGAEHEAMLLDLSLRGVYVATDTLPEVGAELDVCFTVPGNVRELELNGTVAWVQREQTHPVHGLPRGYGIRFSKLRIEDVRSIARAIQEYCVSNPIYRQYL